MDYKTLTNDELIELAKSDEINIETLENEIQRLKKENNELAKDNQIMKDKSILDFQTIHEQSEEIEQLKNNIQYLIDERAQESKEQAKLIKDLQEKLKKYKNYRNQCIELNERNYILENMIKGALN